MSSFIKKIMNPYTGIEEKAEFLDDYSEFLDDYFGRHCYGVRFSNGMIYRESEILKRIKSNKKIR